MWPRTDRNSERDDVNRRTFLRATGTGIALGSVSVGTAVGAEDGNYRTIVTHRTHGTAARTKQVPEKWYDQKERSERAVAELTDRFRNRDDVRSVGIGISDRTVGGMSMKEVKVVVPKSGTEADIPDRKNDVPVAVSREGPLQDTAYRNDYDPVPGGVLMNGTYDVEATTTCKVEKGGSTYMMNCRHVFTVDDDSVDEPSCSYDDTVGDPADQNYDYIGDVAEAFVHHDVALVPLESNNRGGFSDTIVNQSGYIEGYVTKDGISDMQSSGETTHKRGIATGASTGEVLKYEITSFCGNGNYLSTLVKTSNTTEGGDSGGPIYDVDTLNGQDYLFIISPSTQAKNDNSFGSAAYSLHNGHSINFKTR